jgi:hypothetical protein
MEHPLEIVDLMETNSRNGGINGKILLTWVGLKCF